MGEPGEHLAQTIPAYRGVPEVSYSSNWIYLRTTGFGQHIMGPWYDNAARSALFVNVPTNQKALYRIPRTSTLTNPPATKTSTFICIDASGTPIAPWNIGQYFFGNPKGNKVSSITDTVVTNFVGAANAAPSLGTPKISGGNVVLTWSATEGGTYRLESTTNFSNWTTNTSAATASGNTSGYPYAGATGLKFFKVTRTALASYDPVFGNNTNASSGGVSLPVPGGSVSRGSGTNITLVITWPANPPAPPAARP